MSARTTTWRLAGGVILLLAAARTAHAQTQDLSAGAVAIVAYNTDRDDWAWVALRPIPTGTTLCFTDSSVSNGWFRWTEHLGDLWAGPLTWSHTEDLEAGAVVRFQVSPATNWSLGTIGGGRPWLSTDGDQLTIYTGTISSNAALPYPWRGDPTAATPIHAINFANAGWNNATGGDPSHSFVPPGLSTGNWSAVHVDNHDNGYYRGPLSGTARQLRQALATPGNWTTSNDPFDPTNWVTRLNILPAGLRFSFR